MTLPARPAAAAVDAGPAPAGAARAVRTPSAGDLPPVQGVRVLIVDDDRESCDVMVEALRAQGVSVGTAMSVVEAIELLPAFKPDVVLSDIGMPGLDGYALLAEVRAFEAARGRRLPVAAVTAYARPEDREQAFAAGFDDYVPKPVDPAALARTVATLAGMVMKAG